MKDSHYYATRALEEAFCNGGLRKEQWDIKVSNDGSCIPKTESDPMSLKIVSTVSLSNDDGQQEASSVSGQQDDDVEDEDMPAARRHPFSIIPRKQQNNTTQQQRVAASNQEQLTNASQPVGGKNSQSIQITQQNPNCAMVQVVPQQIAQQQSQVRTINAQGTPIQLTGGGSAGGSTTVVPMQQLNQLKQGQVFIMQKVGNTQVLTPVAVQQAQGGTPVPTMVSPTQQSDKEKIPTQRKLAIRPVSSKRFVDRFMLGN